MAYANAQLRIHATIFSNGSIIPTGFKFTKLHALTMASCCRAPISSYAGVHYAVPVSPVEMVCLTLSMTWPKTSVIWNSPAYQQLCMNNQRTTSP